MAKQIAFKLQVPDFCSDEQIAEFTRSAEMAAGAVIEESVKELKSKLFNECEKVEFFVTVNYISRGLTATMLYTLLENGIISKGENWNKIIERC